VPSGFSSVLRVRNFMLLALSCSMSQLGDRLTHMLLITVIALANPGHLLAYSTGSLAFVLPTMLIAPIAGVLVDRWDKRKVLGYAHLSQSGLLFVTAFLVILLRSFTPFWVALVIFFGLDVFNNTASPSLLPALVARRKLLVANATNLTLCRIATVLGMVAGGFLIKWTGWRYGLIINSSTHLTAGLLALAISVRFVSPRPGAAGPDAGSEHEESLLSSVAHAFRRLFRELAEVVKVVGTNRLVGFVMASLVVSMFISAVSYTVLLFLVQQVLHLGTGGVGVFAGILAVGMIAGAAVLGLVKKEINRPAVVVLVVLVYGVLFLAGPWLVSIPFMVVVALVAGVAFSWLGIVQNTMLQEEVSPEIRGRIFSTREFITNVTFLLTTLFIGTLGDLTSWRIALVAIGAILVLLAGAGYAFTRRGRG
jgi:MFS family permease